MRLFQIRPVLNSSHAGIPLPLAPGALRAGLSLRRAGDLRLGSPLREPFFRGLGIDPGRVYAVRQVHSRRVLTVREEEPPELAATEADGLVTDRREALLTVTVADCLPIFLYDRSGRAFALVHSGWQGTGIAAAAVRRLEREYGVVPGEIVAVIGPGIGACCYEVDRARAEGFRRDFGERAVRRQSGPGGERWFLDLRAANAELLSAAAVREVYAAAECTACTPELASFRRDGSGFRRMAAFIGEFEP
jgi:hypothetical protein